MELAAYRSSAESFMSELTAEYFHHYAGLQAEYEIEPIYDRHAELFERSTVDELQAAADSAAPGSAVEGFLGQATKSLEAELARREAGLVLELDGQRIGF